LALHVSTPQRKSHLIRQNETISDYLSCFGFNPSKEKPSDQTGNTFGVDFVLERFQPLKGKAI